MKKPKSYKQRNNTRAKRYVPKTRIERQKLYDTRWTKYRFRFLHHNPKCYCCPQDSSVVDHVRPHKGDIDLFWNITNHIPLCQVCHNTITAKFDKVGEALLEEKGKWIENMREKYNITVKVKVIAPKD